MGYLYISGVSVWRKEFPWNSSRLGPRWMLSKNWETSSADRSGAPNLRKSCGSSWEKACGGNTVQPSSTTSNTSTIKF